MDRIFISNTEMFTQKKNQNFFLLQSLCLVFRLFIQKSSV